MVRFLGSGRKKVIYCESLSPGVDVMPLTRLERGLVEVGVSDTADRLKKKCYNLPLRQGQDLLWHKNELKLPKTSVIHLLE